MLTILVKCLFTDGLGLTYLESLLLRSLNQLDEPYLIYLHYLPEYQNI